MSAATVNRHLTHRVLGNGWIAEVWAVGDQYQAVWTEEGVTDRSKVLPSSTDALHWLYGKGLPS